MFDAHGADKELRTARDVFRRIEAMRNPRLVPALGPHAVYTVSEPSLRELDRIAQERDCLVHIHVAETAAEVDGVKKDRGTTPVGYLERLGLLGPHVVAAHGCWLGEDDVRVLGQRGVSVAHCPVSNMKLATGRVMPLAALRAAGVT